MIIDANKYKRLFIGLQWFIWAALWTAVGLLTFGTFPQVSWFIVLIAVVFFISSFYYLAVSKNLVDKLVYSALLTMIGINFVLNTHFYPTLLTFQAGSVAGKYLAELEEKPEVFSFQIVSHGLDYYSGQVAPSIELETINNQHGVWVYTSEAGKRVIDEQGVKYTLIKSFKSFHVTGLTMTFLKPSTRTATLNEMYLLEIQ
jgi:hypothetical protein